MLLAVLLKQMPGDQLIQTQHGNVLYPKGRQCTGTATVVSSYKVACVVRGWGCGAVFGCDTATLMCAPYPAAAVL